MALADVRAQLLGLAAAQAVDEVLEVRADLEAEAVEVHLVVALGVVERGPAPVHPHLPALAVDDVADLDAAVALRLRVLVVGVEAAHLEDQRGAVLEVVDHHLGVGGLAVVHVAEAAAHARDPAGEPRLPQGPARDVHLVDALVADVAVAGGPHPVPVVVQPGAPQRQEVGRAAPEVVVDPVGDRLGAVREADRGARLVAEAGRHLHRAELALVDVLDGLADAGGRAALGPGGHDPPVALRRLDRLAPLPDVVGDGLLAVDVEPRLAGPHRHQRVPVVGRGDGHRVDLRLLEHLPEVREGRRLAPLLLDPGGALAEDPAVHVAQGDHAHPLELVELLHQTVAAAAQPDHAHPDVAPRADRPGVRSGHDAGRQEGAGAGGECSPEELATVQLAHDSSPEGPRREEPTLAGAA